MAALLLATVFCLPGQLQVVQKCLRELGRIEFAYEGDYERIVLPKEKLRIPRTYNFSGSLKINASTPIIVKEHHQAKGEDLSTNKVSITPKYATSIFSLKSKKHPMSQTKALGGYFATTCDQPHTIYSWFPTASLLVANEEDSARFRDLGDNELNGRKLRLISHEFAGVSETKFWVDLERNGLVVLEEYRRRGNLLTTVTATEVTEFVSKKGRRVWLPKVIVTELFSFYDTEAKKVMPTKAPQARTTTRIVATTVTIDEQASQATELTFSRQMPIVDETKPSAAPLPISANAPPQPKRVATNQKDVMRTITEADVQKAELQSTLRTPPVDWTQRIAWSLVGIGLLGAAVAVYRGQRMR